MILALLAGALVGLGAYLSVLAVLPAHPDLGAALARLHPTRLDDTWATTSAPVSGRRPGPLETRLGNWLEVQLRGRGWVRLPLQDLAFLRRPVSRFLGEKAVLALAGLLLPTVLAACLAVLGLALPVPVPVLAALLLAAALWFVPDIGVHRDAVAARQEFARGVAAYIDLTALQLAGGAGTTQALEEAARVGDSWVFARLREELGAAALAGRTPWDSLAGLADDLRLPELADLAHVARISGEGSAAVYDSLQARSKGQRAALLSREHTRANEATNRLALPVALFAIVFLIMLGFPAVTMI